MKQTLTLSVVILISLVFAEDENKVCPDNAKRDKYLQVMGDHCFRFEMTQKLDYYSARKNCQDQGGDLVMAKSKDVNDFLMEKLSKSFSFKGVVWIGLNDIDVEHTFRWVDGTQMTYNNLHRRVDDTSGFDFINDCVGLDTQTKKWHDYYCTEGAFSVWNRKFNFVCEFGEEKVSTVTPSTEPPCPFFTCNLDCEFSGYASDENGCLKCECDD